MSLVQVTQTGLVPRQHDQVLGLALGLSSLAQVDHGPVDLPRWRRPISSNILKNGGSM